MSSSYTYRTLAHAVYIASRHVTPKNHLGRKAEADEHARHLQEVERIMQLINEHSASFDEWVRKTKAAKGVANA